MRCWIIKKVEMEVKSTKNKNLQNKASPKMVTRDQNLDDDGEESLDHPEH